MDASTYISTSSFCNSFYQKAKTHKAGLVIFCHFCRKAHLENSVFYAPKGSPAVSSWYHEFDEMLNMGYRNYIYYVHRAGVALTPRLFKQYPDINTYFSAFAAQEMALERKTPRSVPLIIEPASEHIFKFFTECNWTRHCVRTRWNHKKHLYPITKFTGSYRSIFDPAKTNRTKGRDTKPFIKQFFEFSRETLKAAKVHMYSQAGVIILFTCTLRLVLLYSFK